MESCRKSRKVIDLKALDEFLNDEEFLRGLDEIYDQQNAEK